MALTEDGSILIGGLFQFVDGTARGGIARIANDPATQTLTVIDGTQITWLRGGAGPEVLPGDFELSEDGGLTWAELGSAGRIAGGWALTGQRLPRSGMIRAYGKTAGGFLGGSAGLVEETMTFDHNGIVTALQSQLSASKRKEATYKKQIKAAKKNRKLPGKKKASLIKSLKKKLKAATGATRGISTRLLSYP